MAWVFLLYLSVCAIIMTVGEFPTVHRLCIMYVIIANGMSVRIFASCCIIYLKGLPSLVAWSVQLTLIHSRSSIKAFVLPSCQWPRGFVRRSYFRLANGVTGSPDILSMP